MTDDVKCEATIVCDKTGELFELGEVYIRSGFYLHKSKTQISNHLLRLLLEKHPNIELDVDMRTTITAPIELAEQKEALESAGY